MNDRWSIETVVIWYLSSFYSDLGTLKDSMREWRCQVSRDLTAEKATEPLLNPVASFGGEGEKECVVNYLDKWWVMDPILISVTGCC